MKEDRTVYVIIVVIMLITATIGYQIYKSITEQEKTYEYVLNGEIGVSSKCWLDNGIAKCIVDNKILSVQNYYEVEEVEEVFSCK